MDSTTIGVAGTLFGAVIGGLLTLAGSIWVYSKEQRAKQNVKRKNLIYSPLYDELQTIYDTVFAKNYYPPHADFSKEKRQYQYAHPNVIASNVFCAWNHPIGMDFGDIFKSEDSMLQARELIVRYFE